MPTSGTSAFTLDIADVIEEAFDRCGQKSRSGYDLKSARRSLDLLFIEWQNRGINFWTVEQVSLSLVAGTASYTLEADTVDIIELLYRTGTGTSQTDYPITRLTASQYANTPNKNTQGRPSNYWLDKQRDAPVLYLWPVPQTAATAVYWKLRRIEDTGITPTETNPDVPSRFMPALVSGLAYQLGLKFVTDQAKKDELEREAEKQWQLALSSDRDRASFRIRPYISRR